MLRLQEPVYIPGYRAALDYVATFDEKQLLDHIDALYGRKYLPDNYTLDQLRNEAIRQTRLDWLNAFNIDYPSLKKSLEDQAGKD